MVAYAPNGGGTPSRPSKLKLDTLDEINQLASILKKGGLLPKDVTREEQLVTRIVAGKEIGLQPIQSINWITIVGGRACIWGDAPLALVRGSGLLVSIEETFENEDSSDPMDLVAVCTAHRVGESGPVTRKFSMLDAEKAGLLVKNSPWKTYPKRMLQLKSRSWIIRDVWPDVLCGLAIKEEEEDAIISQGGEVPFVTVTDSVPLGPQPEILEPTKAVEEVATPAPKTESEPQPITERTLEELSNYRLNWLRHLGINTADAALVKSTWTAKVKKMFGVESAKVLTEEQGRQLLTAIKEPWEKEVEGIFTEAVKS